MTIKEAYRKIYVSWAKEQWEVLCDAYFGFHPDPDRLFKILFIPVVMPFVYLYYFLKIPFQAFTQTLKEI